MSDVRTHFPFRWPARMETRSSWSQLSTIAARVRSRLLAGEAGYALLLTTLFFAAQVVGLYHHEMWRDEYQGWMIARDSHSLAELFANRRYEGHPLLWYLFLYVLSRFSRDPIVMQWAHAVVAAAGVYLFARYAPFRPAMKTLFAFGYFPLFEYGILNRSYVFGMILVFAFCAVFVRAPRNYLLLGLLIALMANVSVYTAVIGLALGLVVAVYYFRERRHTALSWRRTLAFAGFLLLSLAGVAASYAQSRVPPDYTAGRQRQLTTRVDNWAIGQSGAALLRTYLPLSPPTTHFWNDNLFTGPGAPRILACLLVSAGLGLAVVYALRRERYSLTLYLAGTGLLLALTYVSGLNNLRHIGHLYIVLIAALWIAKAGIRDVENASPFATPEPQRHPETNRWQEEATPNPRVSPSPAPNTLTPSWLWNRYLPTILAAQVVAGLFIYVQDVQRPFVASKAAAEFIRDSAGSELPLVGYGTVPMSLSAILDRPIYYVETRQYETFRLWGARNHTLTREEIVQGIFEIVREFDQAILFVREKPLPELQTTPDVWVSELARFTDSIESREIYCLYLVFPMRSARATGTALSRHPRLL